jgi:hypothetical protein
VKSYSRQGEASFSECDNNAIVARPWLRDVVLTGPPMNGRLILAGFRQACSRTVEIGINSQETLNLLQHHALHSLLAYK